MSSVPSLDQADRDRCEVAQLLSSSMRAAHKKKIQRNDPFGFVSLLETYHDAAIKAAEVGPKLLLRVVHYRLGHLYARSSLFEGEQAARFWSEVRIRIRGEKTHHLPADLEFTVRGLVVRAQHHFGLSFQDGAPPRLRLLAHLYRMAMLRRLEPLGYLKGRDPSVDIKGEWKAASEVFVRSDFHQQTGRAIRDDRLDLPDLALYTPLDLLRYAFELDGGLLDRHMTDLALRDPVFEASPSDAEWLLLTWPPWQPPPTPQDASLEGKVVFKTRAEATSFLTSLLEVEPDAVFFEMAQDGESHWLSGHQLGRKAGLSAVVQRQEYRGDARHVPLLVALACAQTVDEADARKQAVIALSEMEDVVRDAAPKSDPFGVAVNGLRDAVGSSRSMVERAIREDPEIRLEDTAEALEQPLKGRDWIRVQRNSRFIADARASRSSHLLIREGVKIYGAVHWKTYQRMMSRMPR